MTPELGKIIDGPAERDAIHVAVMPATAEVTLYPGQRCYMAQNDLGGWYPTDEQYPSCARINPVGDCQLYEPKDLAENIARRNSEG